MTHMFLHFHCSRNCSLRPIKRRRELKQLPDGFFPPCLSICSKAIEYSRFSAVVHSALDYSYKLSLVGLSENSNVDIVLKSTTEQWLLESPDSYLLIRLIDHIKEKSLWHFTCPVFGPVQGVVQAAICSGTDDSGHQRSNCPCCLQGKTKERKKSISIFTLPTEHLEENS